jgi:hypothetical protein
LINYGKKVRPVSLSRFLRHSRTYESMPAPISRGLRRAAWWGIALCAVSLCIYLLLPIESIAPDIDTSIILGEQLAAIAFWTGSRVAALLILSILGAICGIAVLIASRGLREAKAAGHFTAFMVVVIGILCSLPWVAALTILVINVIVGVFMAVAGAIIFLLILFAILAAAFH